MYKKLQIKNLSIHSKTQKLVSNINLEIELNKPLVLLGESGSGKSLIIDCVMGSLDKNLKASGEIFLDELELLSLDEKEKRKLWGKEIALLPQEPWRALNPTMIIGEQIKEVHQYIHKEAKEVSNNLTSRNLKDVQLEENFNSYAHEISGGMAQRTTLAITHASNAKVILVDEPTKGLDRELCDSVVSKLQEEVDNNRLLFVITHDLEIAKKLHGNLGVIVDGELVEYGRSKELLENPKHEYTKNLLNAQSSSWQIDINKNLKENILEVKNLAKSFDNKLLFKDLSFSLKQGETISVVGKSGSGKSSLGNIILEHLKADSGKVFKTKEASKIQFQKIYQDPPSTFLPKQSLKDAFEDLISLHKLDKQEFYSMLKEFKLDESLLNRLPSEVSGGELQRLAIIRVLLLNPVFLFADEATSRLDPISQKEVMFLLINLVKKKNLSLLLITHDIELAKKVSNKVIYLKDYQ